MVFQRVLRPKNLPTTQAALHRLRHTFVEEGSCRSDHWADLGALDRLAIHCW